MTEIAPFNGFGLQDVDPNVVNDRHLFVGGSDVATILGINKYKTQYQLAQEKLGIIDNAFEGNMYTAYGNKLEPQIREYINAVNQTNFFVNSYVDEERSIRSNVDGIDTEQGILLEIKTHGKNPTMEVYKAQMQLYMAQIGVDYGWLALYERPSDFDVEFDADRLQIIEVDKDEEQVQKIYDAIETFWVRCEYLRDKPEMTEQEYFTVGTDMDKSIMKLNKLAPEILKYKEYVKHLETQEKALKEELYLKMTENDIKKIETPLLVITRVLPGKTSRFDTTQFKKDYPDLSKEYTKESERKGYIKLTERKEGE